MNGRQAILNDNNSNLNNAIVLYSVSVNQVIVIYTNGLPPASSHSLYQCLIMIEWAPRKYTQSNWK